MWQSKDWHLVCASLSLGPQTTLATREPAVSCAIPCGLPQALPCFRAPLWQPLPSRAI